MRSKISRPSGEPRPRTRSEFVWDVLVLQIKLVIGSALSFALGPATLVAAFLDLIFKSGSHGSRFYRVLHWGRQFDEALGLYAALHRRYEGIEAIAELNRSQEIVSERSGSPNKRAAR